jgi:prevent-host-death family protein
VKQVNVYEARGQFSKLLDEAEAGEEIVIARNGKPVVKLVPIRPPGRVFGRWRETVPSVSEQAWRSADEAVTELFDGSADEDR